MSWQTLWNLPHCEINTATLCFHTKFGERASSANRSAWNAVPKDIHDKAEARNLGKKLKTFNRSIY